MADKNYFRHGTVQVIAIAAASAQSTAFSPQTSHVKISTPAIGVWYKVGANPTADITTSVYLPPNWSDTIEVAPGEKIACIQPTAPAGTLNVAELLG